MPKAKAPSHAVHYRIRADNLHNHLFQVTLTIPLPAAQQVLDLPVWIPGSYLVREFSKHLQQLTATQGTRKLRITQHDKAAWQLDCVAGEAVQVSYAVYALDNSVRTAWLDASRGFFNGTSLCLRVQGQESAPHTLEVIQGKGMEGWSVATGLEPQRISKTGFGSYAADNYDTLVDCPVEMGPFWSGTFTAAGIPHRFVVAGAPPSFDGDKLLSDTKAICEEEIRFWHAHHPEKHSQKVSGSRTSSGPKAAIPFKNYLFMLNAVGDGYGGLEHRNSTALISTRKDLPRLPQGALSTGPHKQPEGYTTLLGLISHEYFHTWNVKRLRPSELAQYDYTGENYTELLWFFEGFTSYYDDLFLRRAGLIDNATYFKLLTKTVNQVQQTPGRLIQTVAQASFDAWVKYYRQDENTPNATVSYYTKGSLVALCLDLTLRAEGKTTLDAVMRGLWSRCQGGPMTEADLLAVLQELSGRSYAKEISQWVHSTRELPLEPLLEKLGVLVQFEPDQIAQQLGLRVKESGGLFVTHVLRGGAAEAAGFASGDEWIAVGDAKDTAAPWRLQTLEDLPLYTGKAKKLTAWVSRDKRLLQLSLALPTASKAWRLNAGDLARVNPWLDGK